VGFYIDKTEITNAEWVNIFLPYNVIKDKKETSYTQKRDTT